MQRISQISSEKAVLLGQTNEIVKIRGLVSQRQIDRDPFLEDWGRLWKKMLSVRELGEITIEIVNLTR